MHESYKVTHQMFFPISSPSVHLKQNRLCLREYWNIVILCIYQDRAVRSAVMRALQMTISARSQRRKGNPLRKYTIKDTFRCQHAWVPYDVIKPWRSTKLSSFNDVQKAMPQKIRSACLHDSHIGTYPIYIRFISTYECGPNPISLYPNACVFFLFTLS